MGCSQNHAYNSDLTTQLGLQIIRNCQIALWYKDKAKFPSGYHLITPETSKSHSLGDL